MSTHDHFRISGATLTKLTRGFMLEGNPSRAWRLATALVDEDDPEAERIAGVAIKVLQGTHRFVGNEGYITLRAEHSLRANAYRERLAYTYAGIRQHAGRWWQPVAKVTPPWGPEDMVNQHGRRVDRGAISVTALGGYRNREWHYVHAHETIIDFNSTVIYAPSCDRPMWMPPPLDEVAALAELKAAGRDLEIRNHARWYPSATIPPAAPAPDHPDYVSLPQNAAERRRAAAEDELAVEDERNRLEDEARAHRLAEYRQRILTQAAGDLITLTTDDGTQTWEVPRAPFLRWCLDRRPSLRHFLPTWENVCPSGLKLAMDNRDHSDWMIGGGIDLKHSYASPVASASYKRMAEILDEFEDTTCLVLVPGEEVIGRVHHGQRDCASPQGSVVVLPNLHPSYLAALEHAAAVITEAGGKTAHLAQIGREHALPIVLIKDARQRFIPGARVSVTTEPPSVRIWERDETETDEGEGAKQP